MKFRFIFFAALLSLFISACTLAEDITPPPDYKSPTPGPTMSPLYPQNPPDTSAGAAIFADKCVPCHGVKGLGDGPMAAQLQKPPAAIGKPEIARAAALTNWYTVVTDGNIQSFMPPFSGSLSEQQRWDVVAYALTLGGSTAAEAEHGKAVYDVKCVQCHGPAGDAVQNSDFRDQALMAKLNQNDIASFVNKGVGTMPGFGGLMSDTDIYAAAAYVRSFSIGAAALAEVPSSTQVPPASTPAAQSSTTPETSVSPSGTSADLTAVPQGTQVAQTTPLANSTAGLSATPALMIGVITGKISNASGGTVPSGLNVVLHVYEHDTATQQFSEVSTQEAPVATDNTYSFKDVQMPANRAFYVTTDYADTTYQTDPAFPQNGQTTFDLPLNIYDTTTETSGLLADQVHVLLDYTKPDIVQVVEFFIITNPGNKSIIPAQKGGAVVNISLPAGYSNLQFEQGAIGDRYLKTADGFADTTSVTPNMQQYQIVFAFDLPFPKPGLFGGQKLEFSQTIPVKANSVSVLVPEGVTVQGANITSAGTQDMGTNGAKYLVFTAGSFKPGEKLDVSASGAPKGTTQAVSATNPSQNIIIGVGAFGFVLIVAGGWLFWRDRRKTTQVDDDVLEDNDEEQDDISTQDDIMDAIVALDDQFKAGNISEDVYKLRRAELKTRLKKIL